MRTAKALTRARSTATIAALIGLLAASAGAAWADGPTDGVYILRPAAHPGDCLRIRWDGGSRSFESISVGCINGPATPLIVSRAAGGYTFRAMADPNLCVTVARGVIFGAPSLDLLACNPPAPAAPCDGGAADQLFRITGGPAFEIFGVVPLGAFPAAAWDVGDYGDAREVKYWNPEGGGPAKQRFIFQRVGGIPPNAICARPPSILRPLGRRQGDLRNDEVTVPAQ